MNKRGPIVIIEDDIDEHFLYEFVLKDLGYKNEIVFFSEGDAAVAYLKSPGVYPFLVISDINMPRLNGFALRRLIQEDENLLIKCIPYVFFTTSSSQAAIIEAYRQGAQGFFVKPPTILALKDALDAVVRYWWLSYSPYRRA